MKTAMVLSVLTTVCVALQNVNEGSNMVVQVCGRQLSHFRAVLCYGSEYVDKRSHNVHSILSKMSSEEQGWQDPEEPWSGRRAALASRWSRNKRIMAGLSDECCAKPCTTDVILSYC